MALRVDVYRKGSSTSNEGRTDGGVLGLVARLDAILRLGVPEGSTAAAIESCLVADFGRDKVKTGSPAIYYKWVIRDGVPTWVCCNLATYSVDDGGTSRIAVELEVGTAT